MDQTPKPWPINRMAPIFVHMRFWVLCAKSWTKTMKRFGKNELFEFTLPIFITVWGQISAKITSFCNKSFYAPTTLL